MCLYFNGDCGFWQNLNSNHSENSETDFSQGVFSRFRSVAYLDFSSHVCIIFRFDSEKESHKDTFFVVLGRNQRWRKMTNSLAYFVLVPKFRSTFICSKSKCIFNRFVIAPRKSQNQFSSSINLYAAISVYLCGIVIKLTKIRLRKLETRRKLQRCTIQLKVKWEQTTKVIAQNKCNNYNLIFPSVQSLPLSLRFARLVAKCSLYHTMT